MDVVRKRFSVSQSINHVSYLGVPDTGALYAEALSWIRVRGGTIGGPEGKGREGRRKGWEGREPRLCRG